MPLRWSQDITNRGKLPAQAIDRTKREYPVRVRVDMAADRFAGFAGSNALETLTLMLPDEAWLLVGMAFGAETMSVPIVD